MDQNINNGDLARRLLLDRLDRIEGKIDKISDEVDSIKMKVAAIGGIAGLLGWAIPQIIQIMAHTGG